jgi:glycosyltransferase involved in cell wall biosynthesis
LAFELSAASIAFDRPRRLTEIASWHGHLPFAFWCVEALRPRVIVELGTHRGDSYCAFCQAVERLSLACSCFAVDTWRGDHQAGYYGEEVLADLRAHHDGRYGHFSRLLRGTFEEAVAQFADGSIDLLHIDGNHTYEAARGDFENYLPKLSRRAVVLFHDTNVRDGDFGVWRLWEELSARYPHFEFLHSHGLGVLVVGEDAPEPVRALAASPPAQVEQIRGLFAHLGTAAAAPAEKARLAAEVYARAAADLLSERTELERREEQRRSELERLDAEVHKLRGTLDWTERRLDELQRSAPWRIGHAITSVRRIPGRAIHALGVLARVLYWAATFQLRAGLRRRKQARAIRRSGLFQAEHYLAQVRDPRRARRDPIWHFLVHGAPAGLDPNPFFATSEYVARHPEAGLSGENPLVHYARSGGRTVDPGPRFDTAFYLARYPEVAASGGNPLAYYLAHGAADGQICHPSMLPEARARALADELLARADSLAERPGPTRTLVVDHRMLMPDNDSGSVRMLAIVKLLRALGHEVTFASDSPERHPRHEAEVLRLGVQVLHGFAAIAAHLEQEGHRYRFVLLSRPEIADRYMAAARAHAIHATVIYDTVDLHWVRLLRGAEATGNASLRFEAERFRVVERLLARSADLVLAITPEEREALLAEVPGARVEVVPNIHACRPPATPWGARDGLMFIGGFEHVPNVDAVEWFVGSVLPLVQRELPGVVLHVVGSKAPDSFRRLASASVRIEGYVPDPIALFEGSRVFVAPLRYGAGMKGKIGHAMSHGLPVVTTPVGAEGMQLADGEDALVAEGPAGFAAAVVRLYRDELLWSKLSKASVLHVEQRFSEDAIRATLASLFPATRPAEAGVRSASR